VTVVIQRLPCPGMCRLQPQHCTLIKTSHFKSVNITAPPEHDDEIINLKHFSCNKCEERFLTKQFLEIHSRYKHVKHKEDDLALMSEDDSDNQSKFDCDQCSFSSNYLNNLKRYEEAIHKKRKTKDQQSSENKRSKVNKGFVCESCNYRCEKNFNLNRHVTRMH
jgi:hypothetical protein